MTYYSEHMSDLRQRLQQADSALQNLAEETELESEKSRLRGKLEGIRLALDYTRAYGHEV